MPHNFRICIRCNKLILQKALAGFDTCTCDPLPNGLSIGRELNRKEKRDLQFRRGKFKAKK